jgi:hypothetical protein
MTLKSILSLTLLIASGCKEIIIDSEIKGVLSIDKRAAGNNYLEFEDKESKQTRFIHPGRKVIEFKKELSNYEMILMDSRRVQLGRIKIPTSAYSASENTFKLDGAKIGQAWDLAGTRKRVLLRREVHPASRRTKQCNPQNCDSQDCTGWIGAVWVVDDFRYDYSIEFLMGSQPWGTFVATGSLQRVVEEESSYSCLLNIQNFAAPKEIFE